MKAFELDWPNKIVLFQKQNYKSVSENKAIKIMSQIAIHQLSCLFQFYLSKKKFKNLQIFAINLHMYIREFLTPSDKFASPSSLCSAACLSTPGERCPEESVSTCPNM